MSFSSLSWSPLPPIFLFYINFPLYTTPLHTSSFTSPSQNPFHFLSGQTGLVAGWGKTDNSFGKTGTNILHKVLQSYFCYSSIGNNFSLSNSNVNISSTSRVLIPGVGSDHSKRRVHHLAWRQEHHGPGRAKPKSVSWLYLGLGIYLPEFTKYHGRILWRKGYESRWLVIVPLATLAAEASEVWLVLAEKRVDLGWRSKCGAITPRPWPLRLLLMTTKMWLHLDLNPCLCPLLVYT